MHSLMQLMGSAAQNHLKVQRLTCDDEDDEGFQSWGDLLSFYSLMNQNELMITVITHFI